MKKEIKNEEAVGQDILGTQPEAEVNRRPAEDDDKQPEDSVGEVAAEAAPDSEINQ